CSGEHKSAGDDGGTGMLYPSAGAVSCGGVPGAFRLCPGGLLGRCEVMACTDTSAGSNAAMTGRGIFILPHGSIVFYSRNKKPRSGSYAGRPVGSTVRRYSSL